MLNFIFRPRFNNHPASDNSNRFDDLLSAWKLIYPNSVESDDVDFEDWVENAIRFESAYKQYPDANFFILKKNQGCSDLNGQSVDLPEEGIFLGLFLNQDPECRQYINENEHKLVDNYCLTDTFKSFSGRQIHLCGVASENSPNMLETIKNMAREGHQSVWIKINRPKYQIEHLKFNSPESVEDAYYQSNAGLASMHLEGYDNAFIVQEHIPMVYEYRMIVVGHAVVAGAGCIEEFTPLNNQATFDTKVRENRRNCSPVVEKPEIVEQFLKFATRYALSMQQENDQFSNYTLDLAINTHNNNVITIECNSLANYGLYAMNYDAILKSHVDLIQQDEPSLAP